MILGLDSFDRDMDALHGRAFLALDVQAEIDGMTDLCEVRDALSRGVQALYGCSLRELLEPFLAVGGAR